ncbi:sulfotransferase [Salipiger bermudensis]|uniref:Sulfotransferase domain-containing protein n=1 Tax=Salipiger bermudensis (strain DSM 26914 / JCM 13377 / KCTC 12554 / HTCC2601) TaxID=314265 RepID=Q0FSH4_SALBH|nr:sulfotransferase [Salipiger bermudensis]EAU47027.1 hypothetical protein R2601_04648 [Salipiger bermudensis HTCC2601]
MSMAYQGDSLIKKVLQTPFKAIGYKIVRLKPYEELSTPSRADTGFTKLFCIGFNKTATTTVEAVLREHGFRLPKQVDQEVLLRPVLDYKRLDLLKGFVEEYDAFQDLPFSQNRTYIACDAMFPGSKFILTLRDPEKWVESYIRYYRDEFEVPVEEAPSEVMFRDRNLYLEKGYVYDVLRRLLTVYEDGKSVTRWDLAFDRDFLKEIYTRRNAEIISYFDSRPDDLLVIDPTSEPDTGRLLAFLGITGTEPGPFPKLNAR